MSQRGSVRVTQQHRSSVGPRTRFSWQVVQIQLASGQKLIVRHDEMTTNLTRRSQREPGRRYITRSAWQAAEDGGFVERVLLTEGEKLTKTDAGYLEGHWQIMLREQFPELVLHRREATAWEYAGTARTAGVGVLVVKKGHSLGP